MGLSMSVPEIVLARRKQKTKKIQNNDSYDTTVIQQEQIKNVYQWPIKQDAVNSKEQKERNKKQKMDKDQLLNLIKNDFQVVNSPKNNENKRNSFSKEQRIQSRQGSSKQIITRKNSRFKNPIDIIQSNYARDINQKSQQNRFIEITPRIANKQQTNNYKKMGESTRINESSDSSNYQHMYDKAKEKTSKKIIKIDSTTTSIRKEEQTPYLQKKELGENKQLIIKTIMNTSKIQAKPGYEAQRNQNNVKRVFVSAAQSLL